MENPAATETPEQLAAALMAYGAKQLPDGSGLIIKEPGKAGLPPGWRTAPFCLQPCQVATEGHPGLHILRKGEDEGEAVCAKPKGHPGGCLCYPGDEGRYGVCPDCKALVAKRAIKAHMDAHLGINRTDKTTLKHAAQNDLADAILLWMEKNGSIIDLTWAAESKIRLGGWNVSGQWCRGWLKDFAAKAEQEGWVTGFPVDLRSARKLLTENGRKLYADGRPSGAQRVEEAKALSAAIRSAVTSTRDAAKGNAYYSWQHLARHGEDLAKALDQARFAPHHPFVIQRINQFNEDLRVLGSTVRLPVPQP